MSLFAGAVGQEVVQPQAVIEVQAGATLILGCSVMGATLRGPVKWFLGEGPARKLIYAEIGSFERVLRTNKDSNTDFSIAIQNVTQADAGTYYCVKQRFPWIKLLEHGPGTQVVVKGEWWKLVKKTVKRGKHQRVSQQKNGSKVGMNLEATYSRNPSFSFILTEAEVLFEGSFNFAKKGDKA
ncbi:Tyrosine-protein phosphatase non-receptor type substrate 1 [Varanus komodoensis]|nr:Tyrosine-protein phosphatase non-receptor type substrate 1 [Varanus komodoensis]